MKTKQEKCPIRLSGSIVITEQDAVQLSPMETEIFAQMLFSYMYGGGRGSRPECAGSRQSLNVFIGRIRKKVRPLGIKVWYDACPLKGGHHIAYTKPNA